MAPPASSFRSVSNYDNVEQLVEALQTSTLHASDKSQDPSTDWRLSTLDREASVPVTVEEEALRLQALKSYHILDSGKEEVFERATMEVRHQLNAPWAVLAFVDLGRVWFKSLSGLNLDMVELARRDSFCAHTVLAKDGMLVVSDASKDVRFQDIPLVAGSPTVRFYAGVPITTPEGYNIGALCVLDSEPRPHGLTPQEGVLLKENAASIVELLVSRKNRLESDSKRDRSKSFVSVDFPASPTMKRVCSNPQFDTESLNNLNDLMMGPSSNKSGSVITSPATTTTTTTSQDDNSSNDQVETSRIPKPLASVDIPDPKTCDSDPDQYLNDIVETLFGVAPKITPALKLEGYFPRITEEQMAAYSMDIVSATRENDAAKLRDYFEERGRDCLDCYNRFGEGLLNMACRRGFKDIVKFLLSSEVKLSVRVHDDYGRTPLHDACWHPEPQLDICAWILREDPSLFLIADKRGFTPFQYARKSDWPVWRQFLYDNREQLEALVRPEILQKFS